MSPRIALLLAALALVATTQVAAAQSKGRDDPPVPAGHKPPAGMCRIWLKDVPPAQQPAPTDCASAVRNRPADARVIFSDDRVPKLPIKNLKPADDKNPPKTGKPKPVEIKPEG